jgi:phenylacetaldehyde dehydrogenase
MAVTVHETAVGGSPGELAARAFAAREHGALVDGRLDPLEGCGRLPVENPATRAVLGAVPLADDAAVERAVAAARRAWEDQRWSGLNPAAQESVLRRAAALVREHAEELAWLETLDNGKTLTEARGDVGGTAAVLDYYAGWPSKLSGAVHATDRRFLAMSVGEPVGVCAQIVPWNYPLLMASWKLGPALAAGCTVVLKPAEQTPLSALRLGELLLEAGLPAGVVNVLPGDGRAGAALSAHPLVHKVAFTGSTAVGRAVMAAGAPTVKRVTLELGGKNPNVVFADADLDAALEGALGGAFENQGQACIAGSRLLVERSVHDELVARLAERAAALKVAPGWEEGAEMGPLVSAEQLSRVLGYVRGAGAEGAALATAPDPRAAFADGPGHFMAPTVVGGVTPRMAIFREEVFGPVVTVTPFDSEAEAVALANDTEYGLSAGVWTRDVSRAVRAARAIRAGTVWVNAYGSIRPEVPFGGMGQSGLGRELGAAALGAYRESKAIFIAS